MSGASTATPAGPGVQVTVSLVTYQGAPWLPGCLASLESQRDVSFEVLILDNGSTDGSLVIARDWADGKRNARVESSLLNVGYAAGHNRLIDQARGEYVLLLNQDVELDPGFLAAAVAAMDVRPEVGSVQGRLLHLGPHRERLPRIDTTGLVMRRDRRVVSRGQGQPDGDEHAVAGPVWGVDGPAPVYRRAALRSARVPRRGSGWEVLDEDFFLYKEDVDLAWRLRSLGWQAWYAPDALAWHARGTGGTGATGPMDIVRSNRGIAPEVARLSWRNQRLMQIKNEDLGAYLSDLPWIATREILSLVYVIVLDPRRLVAVVQLLRAAPQAMRKRLALRRVAASRAGRLAGGPRRAA